MHDDIERLPALWQHDSGDAERLLAAVRRERGKQQWIVSAESVVCLAGVLTGILLVLPDDPLRRVVGLLVLAYSLAGAAVMQWSRVALVKRLSRPLGVATAQGASDAAVVRRLSAATWIMTGLGALFVAGVLALTRGNLRDLAAHPVALALVLGAALFLVAASLWQLRFGRRRTDELKRLLEFETSLGPEQD